MTKSNNPYKDLSIYRDKIQGVMQTFGATDYSYTKSGNVFHMKFKLGDEAVRVAVYENKDGFTTFSNLNTSDETYTKVVEEIRRLCESGDGSPFNFSILKFDPAKLNDLLAFYKDEDCDLTQDVTENGYRRLRIQSKQGNSLTVKLFDNATLQLQGRRNMLVVLALDYLSTVLDNQQALQARIDAYAVPKKVEDVRSDLEKRLPNSCKRINDVVKMNLGSSLALLSINIPLPEYSAVALPACKGLEGFIKNELALSGLKPDSSTSFFEYFEKKPKELHYSMPEYVADMVGEPKASMLCDCYTLYHDERHSIAHVGTSLKNTRILPNLGDAAEIVTKVFDKIEEFCSKIQ